MPLNIKVKSVQSRGILWQDAGGVSIRIVTADTLGAKYRKQLTVQMIAGDRVVAETCYNFRRVMDRQAVIDRAASTGRLELIQGTYSLAK